ncbi:hypothetical protein DQ04_00921210 [Trypanosoma grayi]|uniref:hypothetical protein n=1 Tax=Trypanosoma grayi TaxID=71804 RepID=UPI0004F43B7D|nr:hypothetical protein DQ04_00921210 [Trypanosoma grayi]KEG13587.1 hypothetical protein DQ04_00921210 [Trypanosoma grayi]
MLRCPAVVRVCTSQVTKTWSAKLSVATISASARGSAKMCTAWLVWHTKRHSEPRSGLLRHGLWLRACVKSGEAMSCRAVGRTNGCFASIDMTRSPRALE